MNKDKRIQHLKEMLKRGSKRRKFTVLEAGVIRALFHKNNFSLTFLRDLTGRSKSTISRLVNNETHVMYR